MSFSHSSCTPQASLSSFISSFLSLIPLDSFVHSWQKGEKYTREYIEVYLHFYMTHVHILRRRNSIGEMHIPREKRHFFQWENLVLFVFFVCFMVLWVMFSIYALLFSSHCVCVLDMHTSLCHCTLLIACSDDLLLCYMVIVVISIWLSCVWSSCWYVSHHVYLIAFFLITLYLSLYYLLYLKSLMCFVQMFQDTNILFQVHHRF